MPLLTTAALTPGALAHRPQPAIPTDDLLLRPWQPDDLPAVHAAYTDPDIRRWHCRTMTDDEVRDWIAAWPHRWRSETAAGWAVTDPTGVLGQISLRAIDLAEGQGEVS
jgi:RimJ/RimL family protein N-acetyltransferase